MRSMTGYAERTCEAPRLRARIAIKSLNHRFFDWNYKGAPLGELEHRLRALAQKSLQRGRIEVSLDLSILDPAGWEISINDALLEKILASLEKASRRLGRMTSFSVDNILRIPQVVELRRKDLSEKTAAFLERGFTATIRDLLEERHREGLATARQIQRHLREIRRSLRLIEKSAKTQPQLLRRKLADRLKEIDGGLLPEQEKVEGEVAFLAQKADIAEEILRLQSHLAALNEMVGEEREKPVGKMLDFLAQEISREVNTINSKSQDIAIIKASLAIKGEVESIRQHVQNIE
jgi:uncharacterized protein (TIGR00255 family)